MRKSIKNNLIIYSAVLGLGFANIASASDHADHNQLDVKAGKISDFYMFEDGGKLVFIVTTGVPFEQSGSNTIIRWNQDITYRFHLDYSSDVACINYSDIDTSQGPIYSNSEPDGKDACPLREIASPDDVFEDAFIEVTIGENGFSTRSSGTNPSAFRFRISYGLADDPFIRAGVNGKNTAAIVVSVDIKRIPVHGGNGYFLGWATSRHNKLDVQIDHAGNPYASQGIAPYEIQTDARLNRYHPSLHVGFLEKEQPDVLILNPNVQSAFPNGRALEDDVVFHLAARNGPNVPAMPDMSFRDTFPYLASPHPLKKSPK